MVKTGYLIEIDNIAAVRLKNIDTGKWLIQNCNVWVELKSVVRVCTMIFLPLASTYTISLVDTVVTPFLVSIAISLLVE